MTRKKWNRLRRKYPQLFRNLPAWEVMTRRELETMQGVSVRQAYARMHSLFITNFEEFASYPQHAYCWHAFMGRAADNLKPSAT